MIIEILQRCLKVYEQHGAFDLLLRIMKNICLTVFQTNSAIWYRKVLNSEKKEIDPEIPVLVDFLSFEETFYWIRRQGIAWMINEKEIEVAMKGRHYWVNVKYNTNIIGYIKIGFNNVFIADYKKIIAFPEKVAYIYDTFVVPEFRGRKVATYLINETCKFLEAREFNKVLCHIPGWNTPSIKAYSKVGFKMIGEIRWLKILGFKILTASPAYL